MPSYLSLFQSKDGKKINIETTIREKWRSYLLFPVFHKIITQKVEESEREGRKETGWVGSAMRDEGIYESTRAGEEWELEKQNGKMK